MKKLFFLAILLCMQVALFATVSCLPFAQSAATNTTITMGLPTSPNCVNPTYTIKIRAFGSSNPWQIASASVFNSNGRWQAGVYALQPCTQYEFWVDVYCNGNIEGGCINGFPFSTSCPTLDCSGIVPTNITTTSAALTIGGFDNCRTGINQQIEFVVEWRQVGTVAWTSQSIVTTGNLALLTNLTRCTSYEYRIKIKCNGVYTGWCAGTLSTLCVDCSGVVATTINYNSAVFSLNGFDDCRTGINQQLEFVVEWRKVGATAWSSQGLVTTGNIGFLNNLEDCTDYEFRVSVKCQGVFTTWCTSTFKTKCVDCSGVSAINITNNSAVVTLNGFDNCRTGQNQQIEFVLEWREAGTSTWTSLSLVTTGSIGFINNLLACTQYEFRVKIKCDGVYAPWCTSTFKTTGCPDCSGVGVTQVTNTSAIISLNGFDQCRTGQNQQIEFILEWREVGTATWTSLNLVTTGSIGFINGLLPCTNYEYRVKFKCSGVYTPWCSGGFKTTGCVDCSGVGAINITNTSAVVTLNGFDQCRTGQNQQIEFILEWREVGTAAWTSLSLVTTGSIGFINNLEPCTDYEFRIKVKCNGEYGQWCTSTFKTTGCVDCTGVAPYDITATTAKISLNGFDQCRTGLNQQINFILEWRSVGATLWNSLNLSTNGNIGFLGNLLSCKKYEYRVKFLCNGVYTAWCKGSFTTLGECPKDDPKGGDFKMEATVAAEQFSIKAYPNPFSQETTLEFALAHEEQVSIIVHDMLGRKIYEHSGTFEQGINMHKISGNSLPAGVLVYTLKTASQTVSGRLIKQ